MPPVHSSHMYTHTCMIVKRRKLHFLAAHRPRRRAHECRGLAFWCCRAAGARVAGGGGVVKVPVRFVVLAAATMVTSTSTLFFKQTKLITHALHMYIGMFVQERVMFNVRTKRMTSFATPTSGMPVLNTTTKPEKKRKENCSQFECNSVFFFD